MRFNRWMVLTVVAGSLLIGCQHKPKALFQQRYERFIGLLNQEEVGLFQAGKYPQAVQKFTNRMASDKKLQKQFNVLKDDQNIVLFTPSQVFRMFGRTLYEKRRLLAFIDLLNKEQTALFNSGKLSDLSGSLYKQLSGMPELRKKFTDLTHVKKVTLEKVQQWVAFFQKVLLEEADFYRKAPDGGAPDWK